MMPFLITNFDWIKKFHDDESKSFVLGKKCNYNKSPVQILDKTKRRNLAQLVHILEIHNTLDVLVAAELVRLDG